jgi:energy-coupling factor transporter ATP-binding protein EcfA2
MLRSQSPPKREPAAPEPPPRLRSLSRLKVSAGDRWFLMGTSGSGKTTALKYLDALYARLYPTLRHYVLDTKMDGDFLDWPGSVTGETCPPKPGRNQRYQTWHCLDVVPEQMEAWLYGIRQDAKNGGAVLEIDELHMLVYKPGLYSKELNTILKTGRSIPLGTIALSQEMSKIPANAYKQAVHRLGFYIDNAARYDKQIWQSLLKSRVEDPPDEFGLYYQKEKGRGEPDYFTDIQEFLGLERKQNERIAYH